MARALPTRIVANFLSQDLLFEEKHSELSVTQPS